MKILKKHGKGALLALEGLAEKGENPNFIPGETASDGLEELGWCTTSDGTTYFTEHGDRGALDLDEVLVALAMIATLGGAVDRRGRANG